VLGCTYKRTPWLIRRFGEGGGEVLSSMLAKYALEYSQEFSQEYSPALHTSIHWSIHEIMQQNTYTSTYSTRVFSRVFTRAGAVSIEFDGSGWAGLGSAGVGELWECEVRRLQSP